MEVHIELSQILRGVGLGERVDVLGKLVQMVLGSVHCGESARHCLEFQPEGDDLLVVAEDEFADACSSP